MWKVIFKRLYEQGRLTIDRLENAVTKGLITNDEKNEIINAD